MFSLKRPGSLLSCFLCVLQDILRKKCLAYSQRKCLCNLPNASHSARLPFRDKIVFQILLRKSQVEGVCVHFKFVILVGVTKFSEEIDVKPHNYLFSILQKKNSNTFWFFLLIFRPNQCKFEQLISNVNETLERFNIFCTVSFFVVQKFVTVCRLRFTIWHPFELLASSFIVSLSLL